MNKEVVGSPMAIVSAAVIVMIEKLRVVERVVVSLIVKVGVVVVVVVMVVVVVVVLVVIVGGGGAGVLMVVVVVGSGGGGDGGGSSGDDNDDGCAGVSNVQCPNIHTSATCSMRMRMFSISMFLLQKIIIQVWVFEKSERKSTSVHMHVVTCPL